MRPNNLKAILKTALLAVAILLVTAGVCSAQSVSVTATRQTTVLPDGNTVPMWGWSCGAAVLPATCTALNGLPQVGGTTWQPPLITVPTGMGLSISLTNSLPVETSLVIVGQLGNGDPNGVGNPVREGSPRTHSTQTATTWTTVIPGTFTPPAQAKRARSFAQEAGPGGGSVTYTWAPGLLKTGTYLIQTGTYLSIQGPMGLYGVLVVTQAPVGSTPGVAYPGISYDADAVLLESEMDPVQNLAVDQVLVTQAPCATPFTGACTGAVSPTVETTTWAGGPNGCGTLHSCYPAAVNYTPLYYFLNGVSFDKNGPALSAVAIPATASTGNVLLRFVNAGSRMHTPSVVGLPMSLIAEDANVLPDIALAAGASKPLSVRVQSEVFQAAGKVYDVMINPANAAGIYTPATYGVFARDLSLSTNNERDGGMQGYLVVNGGSSGAGFTGGFPTVVGATANADSYYYIPCLAPCTAATEVPLNVTDPGKGVVANDVNVYGVQVVPVTGLPANGTLALHPDGTFTYTPNVGFTGTDSFTYYANGNLLITATATLKESPTLGHHPHANPDTFTSTSAKLLKVPSPGVLANDTDDNNYTLTAVTVLDGIQAGLAVTMNSDGSFVAAATGAGTYTFAYHAVNSDNVSSTPATVTLIFPTGNGPKVTVQDAKTKAAVTDYRWIIEEDRTFKVNPNLANTGTSVVPSLATNFMTSYMPVVATGCTDSQSCETGQTVFNPTTGGHDPAVCDVNGICHPGTQQPVSHPEDVHLDPTKYYYISILPGDASNPFDTGYAGSPSGPCSTATNQTPTGVTLPSACGHTMSGAPIPSPAALTPPATTFAPVTVNVEPNPVPTSQITVQLFRDDSELNGELDSEQGLPATEGLETEPGLGDFQLEIWDTAGSTGDLIGQMTYDMFNEPLTNSLNGLIDPNTGLDACPISKTAGDTTSGTKVAVGTIIVCPYYESDGKTQSPLAGQANVKNLMQGRYAIIAHPGAAREAAGEEWIPTSTLDGTHFQDSFLRLGEPAYFQEYGPPGFHVFMGFVNPAIINNVLTQTCAGNLGLGNNTGPGETPGHPIPCNNTIEGTITNLHLSRPPNENLYDSGTYKWLAYTTCYVSLGVLDSPNIAFTKCDANGNYKFTGIPDGQYSVTVIDQWLDFLMIEKAVQVAGGQDLKMGTYPVFTWQTHILTNTYMDLNQDGIRDNNEPGIVQVPTRIRFRNGKFANTLLSDIDGHANFDETFPLFNWYTIESDTTRFRGTGVHVVYDSGGQLDAAGAYQGMLNSTEAFPLTSGLQIPGSVYCAKGDAQCASTNFSTNPTGGGTGTSTGRIDPGSTVTEGVAGYVGQWEVLDWGKTPYAAATPTAPAENGGIRGHVVYSSTRPFDDPRMLFQNLWEPLVPGVTINLYQEGTGPNGTQSLKLIDSTKTSSWDAWAQNIDLATGLPLSSPRQMNCPGQDPSDPFFTYTLGAANQYKCYDGMHNFNQVQPAPYDGLWQFPSSYCASHAGGTFTIPSPSNPAQTLTINCATIANPALAVTPHTGAAPAILPSGKYVVEMVVPRGYELVKEEDKNILIGDNYIAPVTAQFGPIINIFIVPDQASVNSYNPSYTGPATSPSTTPTLGGSANNANPTTDMGRTTFGSFGPGGNIVSGAPCVGQLRIVPDYMSIFPQSGEVAPFAGSLRNLCDRREVTLEDQMQAQTDFFIFTSAHVSSHFTGFVLDDFSSEFDPTSPDFGEKFAVPNLPVALKDFNGVEVSRGYTDQWGIYNGLVYSTWQVNPPNPAGYAPNMMITCMNDPGPIPDPAHPGQMITDPAFNPLYSDFCYENPFMPGDTDYLDTPVLPVAAFAEGYNPPDCEYPDATPAISRVDSSGATFGPYIPALTGTQHATLTITALGDRTVINPAYSGPAATTAPYNQKFLTRHYGFGAPGTVTLGGVILPVPAGSWSDTKITATVSAAAAAAMPPCLLMPAAHCGELIITTGGPNPKKSIDTVTVTIGGPAPTYITPGMSIQDAINAANPGDLIMVDGLVSPAPGYTGSCTAVPNGTTCLGNAANYQEILIMWKPIRLQGVGAASVIIDANPHPAGKMDAWRAKMQCLFNIGTNNGVVGVNGSELPPGCSVTPTPGMITLGAADPLPDEATVIGVLSWDPTVGGLPAEVLLEPALMAAEEGAAITAVGKNQPATLCGTATQAVGNFYCAPSRIDGMSFTNSSNGGGGVFAHGWNHNLEVSNNRVFSNGGTVSGGVRFGLLEGFADLATTPAGGAVPFAYNTNANVHHNGITRNIAFGDEFNTDTPAAGGGAVFCTGTDNYHFNYNFVCGNFSTGDGGGVDHRGLSYNGDISHNEIIFNQSFNPTLTTYGGGVAIEGEPSPGNCEGPPFAVDPGCPAQLSDGSGNVSVDSNLIMGNIAEGGSGGGIRLESVNGTDVNRNPNDPSQWWAVSITNNIIADNMAGWAGGGISLWNAANVEIRNNTIVANDSTATAGVLFDTIGNNQGSTGTPPGPPLNPITTSTNQPAGLATELYGPVLKSAIGASVPASLQNFSNPVLENNIFWQNRAFHMSVAANAGIALPGGNALQNVLTLVPLLNQSTTGACAQPASYWDLGVVGDASPTPGTNTGHYAVSPTYSTITSIAGYNGSSAHNNTTNPAFVHQYCNGSRVPPELAAGGIGTTPGIPDIDPFYPLFTLITAATLDEGNNWVNMRYGPLSLTNPSIIKGGTGYGALLGNYTIPAGPIADVSPTLLDFGSQADFTTSAAQTVTLTNTGTGATHLTINSITFTSSSTQFARTDGTCTVGVAGSLAAGASCTIKVTFRPSHTGAQAGTLNIATNDLAIPTLTVPLSGTGNAAPPAPVASAAPNPVSFDAQLVGSTSTQVVTVSNTGNANLTIGLVGLSAQTPAGQFAITTNGCPNPTTLAPAATCTVTVKFAPTTVGVKSASLDINVAAPATIQHVLLGGTGVLPFTVAPASLSFGSVAGASATQLLTLTNPLGNVTLTLTTDLGTTPAVTFTGPGSADYSWPTFIGVQPNACGALIPPGTSCSLTIVFSPMPSEAANTIDTATMTINAMLNNLMVTQNVTLNGTVTQSNLSATALTFGPQNVGTPSAAQTLTVVNNSATTAQPISTLFSSTEFGRIAGANNCGASLAPSSSCMIYVTFTPAGPGTRNANLAVGGVGNVSLTGTGVPAPLAALGTLTPSPISSAHGCTATCGTGTVSLANNGTATLTISSIAVTLPGSSVSQFTRIPTVPAANDCGTSLAAGASCTITVRFHPPASPATGSRTATLTVTDNSNGVSGSTQTAPLAGTAH